MASIGTTDELNGIKQTNAHSSSIIQSFSDTETQSPLSVSSSGEEHRDGRNGDECYLFDGTTNLLDVETQMMNLDFETQVDCDENLSTQLLDDDEDDDDEDDDDGEGDGVVERDDQGSDRTEVLSDSDDDCEVGHGDNPVNSPCEQNGKDFVVDSDVSVDTKCSSGSIRKSFMSVRTAALRYSGNAARIVTTNRIDSDSSKIKCNIQSIENHVCEDDGVAAIGNPTSAGTRVREVKKDHFTSNCSQNMKGLRDETKPRGVKSVVRELFYEDTSTGNNGSVNDNDITDGEREFPELLAHNQDFAGLSYVDSHEPGEESQVNALGVVDNFLFVNDVQLSPEVRPEKTIKEKTPPVSRAKGSHKLAKKHSLRNPIREADIFDWEDIHEDEGGGDFFCKTKKTFFGNRGRGGRGRISSAESQNHRHLNFSRCQGVGDNNEGSNLGQKVVDLALPESKSVLHNSDEKVEVSEMRSRNNLMKELEEQLDVDVPEQQLEATGTSKDLPDMYDVGFDTQMAAEAMEALFYAPPANCEADNVCQVTGIVVDGSPNHVLQKKTGSKHDSVRKRPSTDSGAMIRQSKRAKMESGNRNYSESVKHSRNPRAEDLKLAPSVKTKGKNNKVKEEQHRSNKNANLGRRSCKLIERRDTVGAPESPHIKQIDTSHSSVTPIENLSVGKRNSKENYGTFTPIACRTRRSKTVKPLKGLSSSKNSGEENKEVSYLRGKRSCSLDADSPLSLTVDGKSSKVGCKKNRKLGNNQKSQHEPLEQGGMHEEMPTTSYECKDILSYHPRGKRTHRKKFDHFKKVDDLNGQSTVGVEQVHGQSITRQKISNLNVGSSCVNGGMKGETQTSVNLTHSTSLSCPGKNSEGSLTGQNVLELGSVDAVIKCSSIMNAKVVPKTLVGVKSFLHCGRKGSADSLLSAEGSRGCIDTGSSNTVNAASKMCMEDDYNKKSYKKSTSRFSLARELTRLDVTETPNPTLKDLRKRRDMTNIRVLFSHHLDEDIIKQQHKISARLGVSVVSSSADATHFVTDKFARTRNMLEAIALGKHVVTHLWIESCGQASCFIDEKKYILRDTKKEKEIGFSMPVSLARARGSPLLQGKQIFITRNIEPSKEMIVSLVKAVDGQVVERIGKIAMKDNKIADDLLILSCEKDYSICAPFIEKGAAVYSSELLLSGIVTQKLEFERYRLFTDHTKRTRSRK